MSEEFLRTYFERAERADRLAHAYLLWGPDSEERDRVARRIAAALLCEEGPGTGPCGKCRPCRETERGVYAGFLEIPGDKPGVDIEEIRNLGEKLAVAFEGRRVVFIPKFERTSLPAANAFLKILEEPGGKTVYILTTGRPSNLLPTIISRCHRLPLSVPPPEEETPGTEEVDELLKDPSALETIDFNDILKSFPGREKRERLGSFLTHLLLEAERRLSELAGEETEKPSLFSDYGSEEMLETTEKLLELSEDLAWNINVDLILESVGFILNAGRRRRLPLRE